MTRKNTTNTGLGDIFGDKRESKSNPLLDKVQSGIYKAITTGQVDPEGRGRLAAYIPKLSGDPDNPLFFQYASPFGGSDGTSNYGMFMVPPDPGLTIMVFFANNGELKEGYWFAVAQQVPDVVSGGPSGKARDDGTGQGKGVFTNIPAAKSRVPDLQTAQETSSSTGSSSSGGEQLALVGKKPLSNDVVDFVKTQEGFTESTQWSYDMYRNGYGTEALFNNEVISTDEAEKRLRDKLSGTRDYVIRFGLDKGYNWSESQVNALTSYVQSGGDINEVTKGGTTGNLDIAQNIKTSGTGGGSTGGEENRIIERRFKESDWFLSGDQGDNSEPAYSNHPRNINVAAQGLYTDSVRGQSSASPLRDAGYDTPKPSKVYGIKSPGQNALTIDDGSEGDDGTFHPSQIRLTTGSGASVILDGSNDFIYMVNSSGSAWVEIGADGHIMSYAQGSISMRAELDINLRADRDVNIDAGNEIKMRSVKDTTMNNNNFHLRSEASQFFKCEGNQHHRINRTQIVTTDNGVIHLNGPTAANANKLDLRTKTDIQNLEVTEAKDILVPLMPTHEPFLRPVAPLSKSGPIIEDPESHTAQQKARNTPQSKRTQDAQGTSSGGSGGDAQNDPPTGLVEYANNISIRNLPLQPQLFSILETAASATGVNVLITSGGQNPSGPRTGSDRHNNGYAADVQIFKDGQKLYLTNSKHLPTVKAFLKAAKNAGALSIGAGPGYMGGSTYHIDIAPGNTIPANSATTWGATLRYASAPDWLKSLMG